ncbi:MAG: ferredoxin [Coriobacteriaceae bacterium]|nr:ferredoxin [Coriobacteriaceae bacterium]
MRPVVDCDLCIACGLCEDTAPEVFRVEDDGCARVLVLEPGHEQYADVREAAEVCPVDAITIEGD